MSSLPLLLAVETFWLVAGIEGIKAGEELTYDYGSDYYPARHKSAK